MITLAATVGMKADKSRGTYTVPTFTLESIEIRDGAPTMGQLRSALNAIEDLLTTRSNGQIFFEDSWEILLTTSQSAALGNHESSRRPSGWRLESITKKS